jgi:hypothetical protein
MTSADSRAVVSPKFTSRNSKFKDPRGETPPETLNSIFNLPLFHYGITLRLTMKTLTVKIPEALDEKLRKKAKASNQPVSEVVRRALVREIEADAVDFSKLAAPYRGMFTGPADLSTREGYGDRESR